ncbi:NifU family protein [Fusibacter paucivorans]|uniref:NifU family protein n=1 Tax=Fusibacter paucivorans TaxID=76009 RepID=A0ABS5PR05_9FIRM|nr:NifU family protein [Fusibacter paucivorans]MBS7527588.1 NifU family protein [Fusibacter paucivorans]
MDERILNDGDKRLTAVNEMADVLIRPKLREHNGDMHIIGIEDNSLKIKLTGACSGCPQADLSTKAFIEATLKSQFEWLESVAVIQDVSPELIDFAKAILNGKVGKAE